MLDSKDIRESALWQSSREWHLATLELRLATAGPMVACACLGALVSFSRRLAGARSRTAAKTLAVAVRSRSGNKIVETEVLYNLRYFGVS